ncbi:UNVERIFIED_CONTAM: hypothetical protein IGO34_35415, partial [Salmonella enterica subsp. enterica serovar Weltevreden]
MLTTTLRALAPIAADLRTAFDDMDLPIEVLVQGSAPKRQLMQRFTSGEPCVLVGSHSFWEGIDV